MQGPIIVTVFVCAVHAIYGASMTLVTDHTLSGDAVKGTPMTMNLSKDGEYLTVSFSAPFLDGPSNRVHLFLADSNHRLTEVEIAPNGTDSALRMYWAPYNLLRSVEAGSGSFEAQASVALAGTSWTGTAKVHQDLLPASITLVNAANVHPVEAGSRELQYDNLYAITNHGIALPDLMVLPRYKAIGARFLFKSDEGYSKEWSSN